MPLLFSRMCQYALRAILYLAKGPVDTHVNIRDMAEELNIPHHVLAKICQTLAKQGLLRSLKGPHGGFALAVEADSIKLIDIVRTVDGPDFMQECALGLEKCSEETPCPIHSQWAAIKESMPNLAPIAETTTMRLAPQVFKIAQTACRVLAVAMQGSTT